MAAVRARVDRDPAARAQAADQDRADPRADPAQADQGREAHPAGLGATIADRAVIARQATAVDRSRAADRVDRDATTDATSPALSRRRRSCQRR